MSVCNRMKRGADLDGYYISTGREVATSMDGGIWCSVEDLRNELMDGDVPVCVVVVVLVVVVIVVWHVC